MKDIRLSRRGFLGLAAVAPISLALPRISAQSKDPCPPLHMGTVAVAAGQMLRVSIFNHSESLEVYKIEVFFLNGEFGQSTGQVPGGTGTFVDFDVAANLKKPDLEQVHVDVTFLKGNALGATVEVFDSKTGATRQPTDPCEFPAPDRLLRFGSIGMIKHQVARLSLFQHSDQKSTPYQTSIIGLDGKPLASDQGTLLSGTGVTFDWGDGHLNFPKLKLGERLQVHATVQVNDPTSIGSALEILDGRTGETTTNILPYVMPLPIG